ncbi:MAG: hypothetical protein GWP04_08300 [Gammaproteobacteria bacterium]|nr:hypothetical protein [Gammaproteobacteria bacterium]
MPTTDPRIATAVLHSLEATGTDLALLQQPDALLAHEPTGDIDIVVGVPPRVALKRAARELEARGVRPAALWHYDVGGTATTFFFDTAGVAGAQVDMLYDPKGLGHYSIRSHALLESSRPGEPFPIVGPLELSIYLFSKRYRKGQTDRVDELKAEIDAVPDTETDDAVRRLVTSRHLAAHITGQSLNISRIWSPLPRISRLLGRLTTPVGFWVHCPGNREGLAVALADRFGAVLVRSAASRLPAAVFATWRWYFQTVQPIRLRPGIVISWGVAPHGFRPRPDFTVEQDREIDDAARNIIEAMSSRFDKPEH